MRAVFCRNNVECRTDHSLFFPHGTGTHASSSSSSCSDGRIRGILQFGEREGRRRRRRKGVSYERPTRHGSEKKEGRAKFDFCESRKGSRVAAWNKSGKLTQTSTVVVLCIFKSLLFHLLECVSKWAGHATKDPLCKGPRGTSHFLEGHKLQENILPRQWGPFQLSRGMSASEQ